MLQLIFFLGHANNLLRVPWHYFLELNDLNSHFIFSMGNSHFMFNMGTSQSKQKTINLTDLPVLSSSSLLDAKWLRKRKLQLLSLMCTPNWKTAKRKR